MSDLIYLDHAATTPLLPAAWEAMRPYEVEQFGNPASSHRFGRAARQALEDARERVAKCLDADPSEVVFTSGATEANNLALFGLAGEPPGTLASSALEHPCVVEPVERLVTCGFRALRLPVTPAGVVGPLPESWPDDLRLAALMLVNHETGAMQPVAELVRRVGQGTPVHCDAAAAVGKVRVSFRELGVTSLALSAHKFRGPKGVGALVVRRGSRLRPLTLGGHQQQGRRPGTESVALAVGMAVALEWACRNLQEHEARARALRSDFVERLRQDAAPIVVNSPDDAVPDIVNISFPGCRADVLLMALDLAGVACSTGSACSSGSLLPSPVLRAMAISPELLSSAMRFSLGAETSEQDVDISAQRIIKCINELRSDSSDG